MEKKRFAVLLCAEDSEYVKKRYGGYFGVFVGLLGEEGEVWEVYRVCRGEFPPDDQLPFFDGFVITGSCSDAHGNDAWILSLVGLLQKLDSMRKKLLGICFGHQSDSWPLKRTAMDSPAGQGEETEGHGPPFTYPGAGTRGEDGPLGQRMGPWVDRHHRLLRLRRADACAQDPRAAARHSVPPRRGPGAAGAGGGDRVVAENGGGDVPVRRAHNGHPGPSRVQQRHSLPPPRPAPPEELHPGQSGGGGQGQRERPRS